MRIVLYICIAISAAIAALGIIYLIADKIRFDSLEAGKPWQQHPMVRACIVVLTGTFGPLVVAFLVSPLLAQLGAPPASRLGSQTGVFVTVLALLVTLGRIDKFERYLTPESAITLSKLIAVEAFFQRRVYAWWLPRVIIALVFSANSPSAAIWCAMMIAFLPYRLMKQRFQTPCVSGRGC